MMMFNIWNCRQTQLHHRIAAHQQLTVAKLNIFEIGGCSSAFNVKSFQRVQDTTQSSVTSKRNITMISTSDVRGTSGAYQEL